MLGLQVEHLTRGLLIEVSLVNFSSLVLNQKSNDRVVQRAASNVQRSVSFLILRRHFALGASCEQLDQGEVSELTRQVQGSLTLVILSVDLCVPLDQELGNVEVASEH